MGLKKCIPVFFLCLQSNNLILKQLFVFQPHLNIVTIPMGRIFRRYNGSCVLDISRNILESILFYRDHIHFLFYPLSRPCDPLHNHCIHLNEPPDNPTNTSPSNEQLNNDKQT